MLGQWHLSKDMMSAILTIFSSYGILNLAKKLGVRFLDKLEKVIDYRSIARVLDLIWVAVGIAINQYCVKKNTEMNNILYGENCENILLKVWNLYYNWVGIWKLYRFGFRIGNFNLQYQAVAAFSCLLPPSGKSRYAESVVHALSILTMYPHLTEKLHYMASFKTPPKPGDINKEQEQLVARCFAFDEALKTFGVRFIKQNMTGNVINEEQLRLKLKHHSLNVKGLI
jgi:hypothetical protein